jgi:hypothetical protein
VCLSAAFIAFFIEVRVAIGALRIGHHPSKGASASKSDG